VKRLLALAPLAALILAVTLFAGWSLGNDPKVVPMALVGKPVPNLTLDRLAGGSPMKLRREISGPTLINFYASWCGPCAQEAPALMALKAEGVRIIGVAYKDDPTAAADFLARLGDPYATTLVDRDGRAGIEFGVTGVPETYAVDAKGMIRAKIALPISPADAETLLKAAGG
jgi:cytochrome c biogenesis protein CcmG, thiol:disulfide interchange protein DsbE